MRDGKDVLEFSVRSTTKGEALEHLRKYTRATAVFYAGDDITDEDAFAALGPDDVGLKSGEGTTLANFRVPGPTEVARAQPVGRLPRGRRARTVIRYLLFN